MGISHRVAGGCSAGACPATLLPSCQACLLCTLPDTPSLHPFRTQPPAPYMHTCTAWLGPSRRRASAMSTVQSSPMTSAPVLAKRSSRPPLPLAYSVSGVLGWVALTCRRPGGGGGESGETTQRVS